MKQKPFHFGKIFLAFSLKWMHTKMQMHTKIKEKQNLYSGWKRFIAIRLTIWHLFSLTKKRFYANPFRYFFESLLHSLSFSLAKKKTYTNSKRFALFFCMMVVFRESKMKEKTFDVHHHWILFTTTVDKFWHQQRWIARNIAFEKRIMPLHVTLSCSPRSQFLVHRINKIDIW